MKYSIKVKESSNGKVGSYMMPEEDKEVYERGIKRLENRGLEIYEIRIRNDTTFAYMRRKN